MDPAKAHRRWIRGSLFWLLVVLLGMVAGSWIKSYWRYDAWTLHTRAGIFMAGDHRARFIVIHFPPHPRFFDVFKEGPRHGLAGPTSASWRYGGFAVEHPPSNPRTLCIPHWFPLLVFFSMAWRISWPWRRSGRREARGFDVVAQP